MAIPHPKQQNQKNAQKAEETQTPAPPFENALFAFLGAVTAIVVGLGIYSNDLSASSRRPASVTEEWDARPYLPYGY